MNTTGLVRRTLLTERLIPSLPDHLAEGLLAGAEVLKLAPGATLFNAGDPAEGCYLLERGVVKVVMSSPQAHERIIAVLGPGSVLGELSILDGMPRSASIIAVQDCKLAYITRVAFRRYANEHHEIYEHMTCMLARRLRETDDVLAASSFLSVKARLARAFLELSKHLGKRHGTAIEIAHRFNQTDLAAMAGIARENVARTLASWKEQKIVAINNHHYWLHDVPALHRQVESDSR